MKNLKSLILELDECLQKYNPIGYAKMASPLNKTDLDRCLNTLECGDDQIRMLYSWKEGTYPGNHTYSIFDFGPLISLKEVIKTLDIQYWSRTFISIIGSNEGDFLLFNNETGPNYGKIHLFSAALLYVDEPISYYDSIYRMLQTTIEAYQEKVLKYDATEDRLNVDFERFWVIAEKYNQSSEYWKDREM